MASTRRLGTNRAGATPAPTIHEVDAPPPYMVGAPLAGALETSNALDAIYEGEVPSPYMVGAPLAGALETSGAPETSGALGGRGGSTAPKPALIASGGVRSLADLHSLAALGIEGAIVGKALYTGDVNLATAIQQIER